MSDVVDVARGTAVPPTWVVASVHVDVVALVHAPGVVARGLGQEEVVVRVVRATALAVARESYGREGEPIIGTFTAILVNDTGVMHSVTDGRFHILHPRG